jgi:hypothetical protein
MTAAQQPEQVFISYSPVDREWAEAFARALRDRGLRVWFDAWEIAPGELLAGPMEKGLRESDILIPILTEETVSHPQTFFEFGLAVTSGKRFIPVIPASLDPAQVPIPLRRRRYLIRRSPEETAAEVAAHEEVKQSA